MKSMTAPTAGEDLGIQLRFFLYMEGQGAGEHDAGVKGEAAAGEERRIGR